MHFSPVAIAAAAIAVVDAAYVGSNYGSTFEDGSAKQQADFAAEFNKAQSLQGLDGAMSSARLYTMIQANTANTPISAIPAAIDTQTTLLLGLWASAGQANIDNEITALTSAIDQYGTAFTDLIAGISVGSEDLYRISPTGIENKSGVGASPAALASYISQVRSAIAGTAASGASIGHVDTWTAWVNGSNSAVIDACDWLGMDAYPYFQTTQANSIENGKSLFFDAYDATVAVANSKDVWVTETGWPASGDNAGQAVPSVQNAETYWQAVYCSLTSRNINTWWYILLDALPTTPNPSFGLVSSLDAAPYYNLACSNSASSSASTSSTSSTSKTSVATSVASPTAPGSTASGASSAALSNATPGPISAPSGLSATSQSTAAAVTTISQSTAAASSAPASSYSAVTSSSVLTGGGKTHTIYSTTLLTITSCATDKVCYTTVPYSAASTMTSVYGSASSSASSVYGTASPSVASSSATTPAAASGTACPADLSGEYQYPHLIVPVNSAEPDKAYGTQYNGTLSPTISSIFNFDLPVSYAGQTCSLVFLFPKQEDLETSAWTFNGKGGISVNELASPATAATTYNSVPDVMVKDIGMISELEAGNSYVIASHECNAGARQSFEFVSTGGLDLEFFNDYNPSPLGAFITVC